MNPLISVVMSVLNREKYVPAAIQSVLDQSYTNFEFIIIDDGSTDRTLEVIRQFTDPRIRVMVNEKNLGISRSSNLGVKIAQGRYIARMDSDDVCLPRRFEKQVEFLRLHPEVGVLGTEVNELIGNGKAITRSRNILTDPYSIKFWLLTDSVIYNPTAMINKEILLQVNGYDPAFNYSEDYELWTRLAKITQITVLPDPLLNYRIHPESVSVEKSEEQKQLHIAIARREISSLTGIDFAVEVLDAIYSTEPISPKLARQAVHLFNSCLRNFEKQNQATAVQRKQLRDRVNWRNFRILKRVQPQYSVLDDLIKIYFKNHDILVSNLRGKI